MSIPIQQPSGSSSLSSRKLLFLQRKNQSKGMTSKEMNISAHRLARPAKITASTRYSKSETAEEYAIRYFKENPDITIDKREPLEKLDQINTFLSDTVSDSSEKFSLLSKKKALVLMIYGENTPELFEAYVQFAAFYNDENKSPSAIRHLKKAQQITTAIEINDHMMLEYTVEYSLALLNLDVETKQDYQKNLDSAYKLISSYSDLESEDLTLLYKRAFILARISVSKGHTEDAITHYEDAISCYEQITNGETNLVTADLYHELGTTYESLDDIDSARYSYQNAFDIYQSLGLQDRAQELEDWLEQHKKEETSSTNSEQDHIHSNQEFDSLPDSQENPN